MSDSFTIEGNKLELKFSTDESVLASGFDIQITANYVNESCVPGRLPSEYSCLWYPEWGQRGALMTAYYNTVPGRVANFVVQLAQLSLFETVLSSAQLL